MVAAFWDDLKTGSGGYVHYYDIDDKVIIQWDDMRTCGDLYGGWYASNSEGGPRQTIQKILNPRFLEQKIVLLIGHLEYPLWLI